MQFDVDDEVLHLALAGGRYVARSGPAPSGPLARVRCDLATFLALAAQATTPARAEQEGRLAVLTGSRAAVEEVFDVLVYEADPGLVPTIDSGSDSPSTSNA